MFSCNIPLSIKANTVDIHNNRCKLTKPWAQVCLNSNLTKVGGFCTLHKAVLQAAALQGNTHAPAVTTIWCHCSPLTLSSTVKCQIRGVNTVSLLPTLIRHNKPKVMKIWTNEWTNKNKTKQKVKFYSVILMDWVTVKTQLLYCSISYLFIAFVGLHKNKKNSNESNETNKRYK
jgi:hypothetical protein